MESATKDTAAQETRRRRAKKAYVILAGVASIVALVWIGHRWLTAGKESTDDAQVDADVVPVSARIPGVVKAIRVHDNQAVKAGEVLFELDTAELDIEVARTEAEVAAARAQLGAADAQAAIVRTSSAGGLSSARAALSGAGATVRGAGDSVRAAEAAVSRARAELATAQSELDRTEALAKQGAVTQRDLEHALQARDVARAALDATIAQLDAAREQRGLAQARVIEAEGKVAQSSPVDQQIAAADAASKLAAARLEAAEVALRRANLARSYAQVTAPVAGTISKLGVRTGQAIGVGMTALMLVPTETYVIANFKESQIGRMKAGDPVDIELDAYGGTFHGVVDTISPATGARFSLIPPDNATGNFVKVVQRVPVKIAWTTPPEHAMRPGLSAEVTVHVAN